MRKPVLYSSFAIILLLAFNVLPYRLLATDQSCDISGSIAVTACYDNGTPAYPADDLFDFTFIVDGSAPGNGWAAQVPNLDGSSTTELGFYGEYRTYTYPIAEVQQNLGGVIVIPVRAALDPACAITLTLTAPASCPASSPGMIDLSLSLQQNGASPLQWTSYAVSAVVSNAGPQTATGVKIKFAKPDGVVYVGGGEFEASQGAFSPYEEQVWTVGSIPPNGSASLTVHYFLLETTAPLAYAQVVAANETDADSQPANGTPPVPAQDDEANTASLLPDFVATPASFISFGISQIPGGAPSRRFGFYFVGQNTGAAVPLGPGAQPVKVGFYLSTDPVWSAGDYAIGAFDLSSADGLVFGNQADLQPIDDNVPGGVYYLIAKMDAGNLFAEPNEDNNIAVYGPQVVLPYVTGNLPDLTVANLLISNPDAVPGEVFYYHFDAGNTGPAAVPGDFTIKSYISADQTLDAGDLQNGTIQTGNFVAGFWVQQVAGATAVPASLPAGTYYLIVKIDADGAVPESNEGNNTVFQPFNVVYGPGGNCEKTIGNGILVCTSQPDAEHLQVLSRSGTVPEQYTLRTLDAEGNTTATQAAGPYEEYYFLYTASDLEKRRLSDGALIYSKPLPAALSAGYALFDDAVEYNGGYILFAYKNQNLGSVDSLFAIKTDAALLPLSARFVALAGPVSAHDVVTPVQFAADRVAFTYRNGTAIFNEQINLVVIDDNLEVKSSTVWIPPGVFSLSALIRQSPCGAISITNYIAFNFCVHGACSAVSESFGTFVNDVFQVNMSYETSEQSTYGQGVQFRSWLYRTADGGLITGTHSQNIPLTSYPLNDTITLTKSLNNATVWVKKVPTPGAALVKAIREAGGQLVLLKQSASSPEVLGFVKVSCLESSAPPPAGNCDDIVLLPGQGQLTIAGFNAPHVLIKVFRPDWTLAFQCLDGACNNPLTVGGLGAGSHYVEIKLLNAAWGEICQKNQTINIASVSQDDTGARAEGLPLEFGKIYPNPARQAVRLELNSPFALEALLDVRDNTGRLVQRTSLSLAEGFNEIELPVGHWKAGLYQVTASGGGWLASGRFLKTGEQ